MESRLVGLLKVAQQGDYTPGETVGRGQNPALAPTRLLDGPGMDVDGGVAAAR